MSSLWVYVSFDGDHIGRKVGRASLADDPDEIRRIGQAIDAGNEIWRSWVLSVGGDVVGLGGDEGRLRIGADHLGDLPAIRTRYADRVGSTVSVGVGTKLSEADRALLAAKLQGGDRIQLYGPDVEDLLAKMPQRSEADKLADEYLKPERLGYDGLQKAQPPALNKPNAGGGITGPSQAQAAAPEAPVAEGSEHNEVDAVQGQIDSAPPTPEGTHAARDLHEEFKGLADDQQKKDAGDAQQQAAAEGQEGGGDDLRQQIVSILKEFRQRAPELEQLSEQDPELYKALVGMVQSMIAMARELFGGEVQQDQQQPVQKTEKGDCKHFYGKTDHCLRCKEPKKLEKDGLDPGKTGRHRVELPVGSQKDAAPGGTREVGKVKVQHAEDGKTSWVSVRAGQVLSQDGHPISSRNPGGR